MTEPGGRRRADLPAEVAALRAERDLLEQRALEAEAMAEQLADALADAQRRLADAGREVPTDASGLTFFDAAGPSPAASTGRLGPDGSDQAVLPLALAATAVVALLAALLSLVADHVSFFTVLAFAAAVGLAWAAVRTRVTPVSVDVVDGVVEIVEGDTTRRFDLRSDSVKIDVQGRPGDASWRVRFYRRALDPVDVDATMVDPEVFLARLRELRPGL